MNANPLGEGVQSPSGTFLRQRHDVELFGRFISRTPASMEKVGDFFDTLIRQYGAGDEQNDLLDFMECVLNDIPGKSKIILDAGCGTGAYDIYLKKSSDRVIAMDASGTSLRSARKYAGYGMVDFVRTVFPPFPVKAGIIDIVFSKGTFAYVEKHEEFLRDVVRITKDDGIIVLECLKKNVLVVSANWIRMIFAKIPRNMSFRIAGFIAFIFYPLIRIIWGDKARKADKHGLNEFIMEVFFTGIKLNPISKKEMERLCNNAGLCCKFLNVPGSKVFSPRTSFVILMRKHDTRK